MAHDKDASVPVGVSVPPPVPGSGPQPLGFRDRYLRRMRTTHLIYRVVVGVVGSLIIALGIVMLPLPGPGWLVIFAGLAILASEFAWAERLLDYARDQVLAWTHWVTRQSLTVRLLIGLATVLLVLAALVGYFEVVGVPGWFPDGPENRLDRWLP